jgi:integrase
MSKKGRACKEGDTPGRELAKCHKPSSIDRIRAAIRMAHESAGYSDPTDHISIRKELKGIRNKKGTAKTKKAPTLSTDIKAMIATLPESTIGIRDKALLLIGFAGAFRRSELVDIQIEHLQETTEGIKILLPRSKTDQEGAGRLVAIRRGANPATCPVRALKAWIEVTGIVSGSLFRRVDRHGNIKDSMTAQSVALVVKRAAEAAGLDASQYSGHSLRAGFVTQGAINGATETNIMRQTGHKSYETVRGYIRIANIFQDNVSGMLDL